MPTLLELPDELLESILIECDPLEVAQLAQTCRSFQALIYHPKDESLWRNLYLSLSEFLDDPRKCVTLDGRPRPPIDWRDELQRVIRARTLISNHSVGRPGELTTVLQTLIHLASHVPILDRSNMNDTLAKVLVYLPARLCNGWLDLVEEQQLSPHQRQLVARIHTMFGLTQHDGSKEALVMSRGYVYNMQNYTEENLFGPFLSDGRVNWEHARAIHHVVSMQYLQDNAQYRQADITKMDMLFYQMSLPYTQITAPAVRELDGPFGSEDWAGINGDWKVSFCFCDHRELLGQHDVLLR